jgi:ABC-type nitrate/sulfonate/bicarbonate transport system substrate-binding protein
MLLPLSFSVNPAIRLSIGALPGPMGMMNYGAMRIVRTNIGDKRVQRALLGFFLFALPLLSPATLHAAERRLQIGFVSFVPGVAPLWVASDRRFFAQEGLDPELVFIGTAPTMVASLMARETPLALTAGTAVMSAIAGGAPLKILATFTNWLTVDLVARPGIVRAEDLRDKRIGVQSIGGGIWMQALLALERLGLEPARDRLHLQVIGPQAQLAKALEAGAIDATVLPPAFSRPLKARGFPILLEVRNTSIPLTVNSLIALKETAEQSPQLIEAALRGLLRALVFIHQPGNRDAVIQILQQRMRVERAAAEEAYLEALETLDRKPYPSLDGLSNIRRMLARANPKAAAIRLEDAADTRALRRLDESGFIDALYGAPAGGR